VPRARDESGPQRPSVLELIRDAILNAEFVPDQRLVEADLSERFLASRSAVRFALLQLATEGLVERIPHRGARVRAVSLDEAIEITEVRMAVEGLCAAKAAERVTEAEARELRMIGTRMADSVAAGDVLGYAEANRLLHRRVRELSGQATAVRVLEQLRAQSVHHHFGRSTRPERPAVSLHEHQAIIAAICDHDPEAAERVTRLHMATVLDGLRAIVAATSGVGSPRHPAPSERARDVVRDAYDVHIHVAPDVTRRHVDDISLAQKFLDGGLAGFVLRSDYFPTAERAAMVRTAVPGFGAVGAITLNGSVGGMNPVAVELARRSGVQVVWLPTADSASQREHTRHDREEPQPPEWAQPQDEQRTESTAADPVEVVGPDGEVLGSTRRVLRVIAEHDMTLTTCHLGPVETEAVVDAAVVAGVRRILVTQPESPSLWEADWQRRLAARGALLERRFTTPFTGKISWAVWLEGIRAVGVEHSVLSSGLGQLGDPPIEDGLALVADRLFTEGFTEDEVRLMAVRNSRWLVGADDRH
jgi:DNA-binding GntR family transcriptional regulator